VIPHPAEETPAGSLELALIAAVLTAAVLVAWPTARAHWRWMAASIGLFVAYAAWHLALVALRTAALNVDYGFLLGLSIEDIGSGLVSAALAAAALRLNPRDAIVAGPLSRVAIVAGILALIFDRLT
jgi:hypothetical protein